MIARGFKSVIWAATVGGAALGCYMVSLRVATERNELARVERQIVEARKDIRALQTELGTRARMTQLEQWNAEVLALSAPSSQQFLKDEFTLARLYRNDPTVADRSAEVRLASAGQPAAKPAEPARAAAPAIVRAVAEPAAPPPLVHRASLTAAAEAKPAAAKAEPLPARADAAKPARAEAKRSVSAAAGPEGAATKPASARPPAKPAAVAAKAPKPAAVAAKPAAVAAKAAAKPATVAARPLREAAAATRPAKGKATGGN